jgi:hypothetical protein
VPRDGDGGIEAAMTIIGWACEYVTLHGVEELRNESALAKELLSLLAEKRALMMRLRGRV